MVSDCYLGKFNHILYLAEEFYFYQGERIDCDFVCHDRSAKFTRATEQLQRDLRASRRGLILCVGLDARDGQIRATF